MSAYVTCQPTWQEHRQQSIFSTVVEVISVTVVGLGKSDIVSMVFIYTGRKASEFTLCYFISNKMKSRRHIIFSLCFHEMVSKHRPLKCGMKGQLSRGLILSISSSSLFYICIKKTV
jgi:hypothetical protein